MAKVIFLEGEEEKKEFGPLGTTLIFSAAPTGSTRSSSQLSSARAKRPSRREERAEIDAVLAAHNRRLSETEKEVLEISVQGGRRVIRSRASWVTLFVEVSPGKWEVPKRTDDGPYYAATLAMHPLLTREDVEDMLDGLGLT
ncbi:hypothetical protein [Sutterella sp.]|uniref:hypothetical protein n=1 Tax=Sutterella sp. TaxID=1981025 RepID=UPI0026DF06E2|nr:hypothetical protein [Sutterella sp.]MDO5532928.1 hypothetical protein [Sutterella sp.]